MEQQHGGSSSDAADSIDVDIGTEAVRCPKCLHPLTPPVYQCATGHQVCSTCHANLADKNKCASCFVTAGFTRCSEMFY